MKKTLGIAVAMAVVLLAACGGGGGGSSAGPPPVNFTPVPTSTPTSTPAPTIKVSDLGSSATIVVPNKGTIVIGSSTIDLSKVSGVIACAYRGMNDKGDSHHCSTAQRGTQGNFWEPSDSTTNDGTATTSTFSTTSSSGGNTGIFALQMNDGSVTLLDLTSAAVQVAAFKVNTNSTSYQIAGSWTQGTFQPVELVKVNNNVYLAFHSSRPLAGTGTNLATQGFATGPGFFGEVVLNPGGGKATVGYGFGIINAGNTVEHIAGEAGDIYGTSNPTPQQCGTLLFKTTFVLDVSQMRDAATGAITALTPFSTNVCYAAS